MSGRARPGRDRARRRPGEPGAPARRPGQAARPRRAHAGRGHRPRRRRGRCWPRAASLLGAVAVAARVPARVRLAARARRAPARAARRRLGAVRCATAATEHAARAAVGLTTPGSAVFGAAAAKAAVGTLSAVLLAATTTRHRRARGPAPAARAGRAGGDRRRHVALRVRAGRASWRGCGRRSPRAGTGRATCCRPARPGGSPPRCSCARTPAASASTSRWSRAAGPARRPRARRTPRCAARDLALRRRARRAAARPARRAGGGRMTCAVHARGLTLRLSPPAAPVLAGLDLTVDARRARRRARPERRRQDDADAAPQRAAAGRRRAGGRRACRSRADTLPALRARVGLVFQDPDDQLFMTDRRRGRRLRPAQPRATPTHEVAARTRAALAAVRMEAAAERAPHQLSMGERRRVAIAGVLAMEPQLLVLDEPSANLDPRARRDLLDLLAALDRTLLVVTHDLPFAAELCERAVILSGGRIVADGPCDAILGRRGAARAPRPRAARRLRPRARDAGGRGRVASADRRSAVKTAPGAADAWGVVGASRRPRPSPDDDAAHPRRNRAQPRCRSPAATRSPTGSRR